jgi:hypothetical protein
MPELEAAGAVEETVDAGAEEQIEEISTETTEGEAEPGAAEGESQEKEGAEPTENLSDPKLPLYKQAKGVLSELQKTNPTLANRIKTSLIALEQIDKKLGERGALDSLLQVRDGLRKFAESTPELQGRDDAEIVKGIQDEVGYWRDLDVKLTNGDPAAIEVLATEAPEGFLKMAPAAFEKFATLNPEGYSAYISQVLVQNMDAEGLPVAFEMLKAFVPQLADGPAKEKIVEQLNKFIAWTNGFREAAKKPVVAEKKAATGEDTQKREQELAQRELDVTRKTWNAEATSFGVNLVKSETMRLAGKKSVTDEQHRQIMKKVNEEVDARLAANLEYGKAMRGYLTAKNQNGYTRRLHSEYQKMIPNAVRRAYDDVVASQKTAVKPPVQQQQQKPGEQRAKGVNGVAGVVRLREYPKGLIDMRRTTGNMMMKNEAFLKDGRHVSWPGRG